MRAILISLFVVTAAWAEPEPGVVVVPATRPATTQAGAADAEPITAAGVAEIVARLGSDRYAVREAAQTELESLGPAVCGWVAAEYVQTDDAEVRMRLERYAQVYFDRHLMPADAAVRWPSFLGVRMSSALGGDEGIVVEFVMDGMAAAEAGFMRGDRIVSLDGQRIGAGVDVSVVIERIRSKPVGTAVRMGVVRGDQEFELVPTLRRVPDVHLRPDERETIRVMQERYDQLRGARWEDWWERGFSQGLAEAPPEAEGADDENERGASAER